MLQFLRKEKNNIIILIITFSMIGSLGVEAGYLWDPFNRLISESISRDTFLSLFKTLFNLVRTLAPLFLSALMLFYFTVRFQNIKKHINLSIIIFFTYSICGVIGYFVNLELYPDNTNLEHMWRNTYVGFQSIAFFSFLLLLLIMDQKNFENYLKLMIATLFLVYCYFSYLNLNNYFYEVPNYDMYATDYNVNGSLLGYAVPRSSGLSRVYLMIAIGMIVYLLSSKNEKKYNFVFYILLPIVITLLFLLNSRVAILSLYLMAFLIFVTSNENFFNKILLILGITILSYSFLIITPKIKSSIFYDAQLDRFKTVCNLEIIEENLNLEIKKELFKSYIQFRELKVCNQDDKFLVKAYFPELFQFSPTISSKSSFNIIDFFFISPKDAAGSRVTLNDRKNDYLSNKNKEQTILNLMKVKKIEKKLKLEEEERLKFEKQNAKDKELDKLILLEEEKLLTEKYLDENTLELNEDKASYLKKQRLLESEISELYKIVEKEDRA